MFIHCTVLLEFVVMYSSIQITMITVFGEFVMFLVSVLLTCLEFFAMLVIITLFFRH